MGWSVPKSSLSSSTGIELEPSTTCAPGRFICEERRIIQSKIPGGVVEGRNQSLSLFDLTAGSQSGWTRCKHRRVHVSVISVPKIKSAQAGQARRSRGKIYPALEGEACGIEPVEHRQRLPESSIDQITRASHHAKRLMAETKIPGRASRRHRDGG